MMVNTTNESNRTSFLIWTAIAVSAPTVAIGGGGRRRLDRIPISHLIQLFRSFVSSLKENTRLVRHVHTAMLLAFEGPAKSNEGYVDPSNGQKCRGNPRCRLFLLLFLSRTLVIVVVCCPVSFGTNRVLASLCLHVCLCVVVALRSSTVSHVSFEIRPILPSTKATNVQSRLLGRWCQCYYDTEEPQTVVLFVFVIILVLFVATLRWVVVLFVLLASSVVTVFFQENSVAAKNGFVDSKGHRLVAEGSLGSKEFGHLSCCEGEKQIVVPVSATIVPIAIFVVFVIIHVVVVAVFRLLFIFVICFYRSLGSGISSQHPFPGALLVHD
mmetsp:Transcript_5025/g.11988  ORF Transcript_5025/g.11988 Transcript_5025/m.11988 type:complete len:326 (-) Transcript_5025:573-1550(-)